MLGGKAEGVVAGARSDVGNDGIGGELEELDSFRGRFFFLAIVPLEPFDGGVAHDLGDFAIHVIFSGAIAGLFPKGVVAVIRPLFFCLIECGLL